MKLLNKTLDEMDYTFIKDLVNNKIKENYILEYKGHEFLYKGKSKDIIESDKHNLAKKICGFANTQGGFIIFGIEEERTKEPFGPKEITGTEIKNFEGIISQVVMSGVQFPCIFKTKEITNEKDGVKPIYILEIPLSPVPVMLFMKGHKSEGTFPIRIGQDTIFADRNNVEMLFMRSKEKRLLFDSAQKIYDLIKKLLFEDDYAVVYRINLRLRNQFKNEMPKLGITPEGEELHILNHYSIFRETVTTYGISADLSDEDKIKNLLSDLRKYWEKDFKIYIDPDR